MRQKIEIDGMSSLRNLCGLVTLWVAFTNKLLKENDDCLPLTVLLTHLLMHFPPNSGLKLGNCQVASGNLKPTRASNNNY